MGQSKNPLKGELEGKEDPKEKRIQRTQRRKTNTDSMKRIAEEAIGQSKKIGDIIGSWKYTIIILSVKK
jgi:hypothetical protein